MSQRLTSCFMAVLLIVISAGCKDDGRTQLSGTVTYDDKPIPRGTISFRPDRSRGGAGPAGHARIVDGLFSTRDSGKGAIAGPIEVAVEGYASADAYAPPLFRPYRMTTEVTPGMESLEIAVPPASERN